MLAALLIMVLAATFALIVVGAVHSLQVVERSDAAGRRAERAAGKAVTATTRTASMASRRVERHGRGPGPIQPGVVAGDVGSSAAGGGGRVATPPGAGLGRGGRRPP